MINLDEALKYAEYAAPLLAAPFAAKIINQNTPKWTYWTGTAGRVIGLATAVLDVFRHPAVYASDVKPPKKKVKKK